MKWVELRFDRHEGLDEKGFRLAVVYYDGENGLKWTGKRGNKYLREYYESLDEAKAAIERGDMSDFV